MAKNKVITEEMIEAAFAVLDKRIAEPPTALVKIYSRRDAFLKLRARAKGALAAGHSLETVLDDLKGIGIGMTISTARQYLKPGRKAKRSPVESPSPEIQKAKLFKQGLRAPEETNKPKGTFTVMADETDI
jgi:hypothetical protein